MNIKAQNRIEKYHYSLKLQLVTMTIPFEHLAEPYANDYFLMSSIYPILGIVAAYLWFCLKGGPHFMRNREPFELKKALICYNLIQITFSAYIVQLVTFEALPRINFKCEPLADASTPFGRLIMFVLRKKFNQVTTLHLYHHTLMVLISWMAARYFPGGNAWCTGYVNSSVHVIMYSYYLWSALKTNNQNSLWWKKYITILQMVQFVVLGIHAFQSLFRDCNYPKFLMVFVVLQSILFLKMFGEFYIKTYVVPKKSSNDSMSADEL